MTFLVGPGGSELRAVKALLAIRSSYFRSILYGSAWAEEGDNEFPMPDWGPAAFQRMLEYIPSEPAATCRCSCCSA